MRLGEFGVWTTYHAIGEENPGEAAKLLEDLGFGTLWLGGSPRLPALRPPLEATDWLVLATGILNVWASEPERVASDFAELETRFSGPGPARDRHRSSRGHQPLPQADPRGLSTHSYGA